jgi:hypothetical protein
LASPDSTSQASLLSDLSFFSPGALSDGFYGKNDVEPSFSVPARCHSRAPSTVSTVSELDACMGTSDSTSDTDDCEMNIAACPSMDFCCSTPTGSIGSPRDLLGRSFSQTSWSASSSVGSESQQHREQEVALPVCLPCAVDAHGTKTKLKSEAPAFQSTPSDSNQDAVVNAVHLALVSCGRAHHIKIDRGVNGKSSVLISAEVQRTVQSSSQPYDVVQLAKQALDAITAQLHTVALLSARVQKEESGYSLRSSVACMPEGSEDRMCWDLFQKGCCPRRKQCQWHHPQDSDISRIKVSIRYAEETSNISGEKQPALNSSTGKRKISLGELV